MTEEREDLNPYFSTILGFVNRNNEFLETPLGETYKLVMNGGSDNKIKVGQRVLVFALGKELVDPISDESLGRFEIVRGEGRVCSVQRRLSVVESVERRMERTRQPMTATLMASGGTPGIIERSVDAPFKSPSIGDLVRLI